MQGVVKLSTFGACDRLARWLSATCLQVDGLALAGLPVLAPQESWCWGVQPRFLRSGDVVACPASRLLCERRLRADLGEVPPDAGEGRLRRRLTAAGTVAAFPGNRALSQQDGCRTTAKPFGTTLQLPGPVESCPAWMLGATPGE